jgi:glycosyltransferase involved in cell wall biosynthesis
MRIGIDVRYISHALTGGVRTYVYHLARELPRVGGEHQFFYYADDKAPFELDALAPNVVLRLLPWQSGLSSVFNDQLLGKWMERDGLDVVHAPANYGPGVSAPVVLTLHDTLNLFPMSQHLRGFGRRPRQVAMMFYLGRLTRASLNRAARVITVSHDAARDIAARTQYPLERITVIYQAASEAFSRISGREEIDEIHRRFDLWDRYILADAIKNPAAVLDAHAALPDALRRTTQIVFFSREAAPRPAIAAALDRAEVRFITQPSTQDLARLMNAATLFAFPSWYEGFGIPLVEAMRCGLPVVGSSRGSIPEIVGDAGLIFELEHPAGFADALQRVLTDDVLRRRLSTNAAARSRLFSWQETARQTLAVYEASAIRRQHTA